MLIMESSPQKDRRRQNYWSLGDFKCLRTSRGLNHIGQGFKILNTLRGDGGGGGGGGWEEKKLVEACLLISS